LLTTERLVLRKPTLDDVEPAAQMLRDPQVMRWLGGVEDDPAATVRRWIEDWDRYPAGKFVVVLPNGTFVGRVGLNFFDTATWTRSTAAGTQPELGWALASEHWGKGYATEAARAVRDWFAAPYLISLIDPSNRRSKHVAKRLGAHPAETVDLPGDGPHIVWVHP
jgi:RimJ/RimL family protein N-acetyltransferase